ncbi:MAG TPA: ATP-binding protein, partial [Candidatus Limnocylindrales bacterium]
MAVMARETVDGLFGRLPETGLLDGLLQHAADGRGGALLLHGEPGIGKTVLLEYAATAASGFTVLHARGIESETQISFSGLSELLRPLLDRVRTLPARQAEALESALAIGPPVSVDRFAVAAATLSLLAAAAADQPVLALVDDLQWLDTSSAEALLFAARRVDAEPICLVFASRSRSGEPVLLGIPERRVEGLDLESATALLAASARLPVAGAVVERLLQETGGNPLALVELPRLLSADQLAGQERVEGPIPIGDRIERAYAGLIAQLPAATQRALVVAAAADTGATDVLARALAELGLGLDSLEPAEAARMVTLSALRLDFRHPLIRSAAYCGASGSELRAVHGALARALAETPGEHAERRAWHLAAAALGPDEQVAAALEEAAARARGRSGYSAAALAFERAAQLSPEPAGRARRLHEAAASWQLANRSDRAMQLIDEAEPIASDPMLLADLCHLRGRIDSWRGPALDAHRRLRETAESLAVAAPSKAAEMFSDAVLAGITGGNLSLALEAGHRAVEVGRAVAGRVELIATLQLGKALILTGSAGAGRPLIMRCVELLDGLGSLEDANELAQCAPALMAIEEYDLTYRVLGTVVASARAASAMGVLGYSLGALAELETRTGQWSSASADGHEASQLAREAGQEGQLSYNLARLARLEAAQGKADDCRAHVAEAVELASRNAFGSTYPFANSALGLLELGLGDPAAAIAHLEATGRQWAAMGFREPGRLEWQADLIEAYVKAGRRSEAEVALAELDRAATHFRKSAPLTAGGALARGQV